LFVEAREGDLIEVSEGALFDVKGLVHPPRRVVAFIRYYPNSRGERLKGGVRFSKVYSLSKRYNLLKEKFPQYLVYDSVFDEWLCEVPHKDVVKHYRPTEYLRELRGSDELDPIESLAVDLAETLKEEARIPWSALGVSGSILSGIHNRKSDLDLVVYGSDNCRRVYAALLDLTERGRMLKRYDIDGLRRLYAFRAKDSKASFEEFLKTETRKVMQGIYQNRDYFLRFVKDWGEVDEEYGSIRYRRRGRARLKARIADDSESIFTPCRYRIDEVDFIEGVKVEPLVEIASFRGRFCEQARVDEWVIAEGKVEMVQRLNGEVYYRLLLGNSPLDQMIRA